MAEGVQKSKRVREFGDFQTPPALAAEAIQTLAHLGVHPRSILEPTCGRGAFLTAAAVAFPGVSHIIGIDINPTHVETARRAAQRFGKRVTVLAGDFFKLDWRHAVTSAGAPWLILGNPPWVTSSELGAIDSRNLPRKSNFDARSGIEAITGKSNFDISEWMLLNYLDWLNGSEGSIAVLCKIAVARKILARIWAGEKNQLRSARIYKIDALRHFEAAVEACFFVLQLDPKSHSVTCEIFPHLKAEVPSQTFGLRDGCIVHDLASFDLHRNLMGPEKQYVWRSGVKHDCSRIMELEITPAGPRNGMGETVRIEESYLFPLLKSSDIGNGRIHCRRMMLVPQQLAGEDTSHIGSDAPQTWRYLQQHRELLGKRGSAIYRKKPPFSIFGVGPYTFAPWKVAISGFYKKLNFIAVGPCNGKPVVFDDTVYFLPCSSEEEARFIEALLNSPPSASFLGSIIHWDEKRPVTVEILRRLSIRNLAALLNREDEYHAFTTPLVPPLFAVSDVSLAG